MPRWPPDPSTWQPRPRHAELTEALQRRWEESLRARAVHNPHSPVRLLDDLLSGYREAQREKMISQIPPKTSDYPTSLVG